jgi:hypothetical protein
MHAHRGTAGRETTLGIAGRTRAGGAARLGVDLTSTHGHLAPPAAGPARGPWAAGGPEELRDSERSRGCWRDAVTVCFHYFAPQVTVSDISTFFLKRLVRFRIGRCESITAV